ncbi:hypothetical protein V2G26_002653 [Clonostachys chloroleuca]
MVLHKSFQVRISLPQRITDAASRICNLLSKTEGLAYYAYEHDNGWFVGIGSRASLVIDATGGSFTLTASDRVETHLATSSLPNVVRDFVVAHRKSDYMLYGLASPNYARKVQGLPILSDDLPLLSLMVPFVQVTVQQDSILVIGDNPPWTHHVADILDTECCDDAVPNTYYNIASKLDLHNDRDDAVTPSSLVVENGKPAKIALSEPNSMADQRNMFNALFRNRRIGTPRYGFAFNHFELAAVGFHLERSLQLKKGKSTSPDVADWRYYQNHGAGETPCQAGVFSSFRDEDTAECINWEISNSQDAWAAFSAFLLSSTGSTTHPKSHESINDMGSRGRYIGILFVLDHDDSFFEASKVFQRMTIDNSLIEEGSVVAGLT